MTVIKKQFEKSYAARPSAENILVTHFDKELDSNIHNFKTSYLSGSIAISDLAAFPAQILVLVVKISMKEGFNLYGNPIPEGYTPFSIELNKSSNFTSDEFQYPKTEKIELQSLKKTFHILPNEMVLTSYVNISKRPRMESDTVKMKLNFQACDGNSCMIPEELEFQFPITITRSMN